MFNDHLIIELLLYSHVPGAEREYREAVSTNAHQSCMRPSCLATSVSAVYLAIHVSVASSVLLH